MSSYRQILYQIVFCTKHRQKTLNPEHNEELFKYIWGIIKNRNCHLYRINGMEEHVHILSDTHPSIALADFVRDIKTATSIWLKESGFCPDFIGWADGYAAFTYSYWDKDMLINYIINQQQHHQKESFEDEYRRLLNEHGVTIDERYFLR
ncbi:IS200/IS605 family transposase [Carboxylicivirga mesophila]|uniref:IS200/IS605 family transposase n=1 Tax=Carboxylicivirga mesophila TaxID=1166478 RepID=A0ABS5KC18_9BACT|nr:IS200/IS605 family transposase [Carboxylicivirga mesophila]MBS2212486.1 IS200/IS605 family transposase [Carboxylicivirga mesophila]